jgi:hypothetical protein
MKRVLLILALAVFVMAGTAIADTISTYSFTQGTFTANLTVNTTLGTATLTFGGLNSYYTDQVAIHLANGGSVTGGTASSGNWVFQTGNNSVNCSGTGNWFCAVATSPVSFNGLSLTWNFSGTTIDPASVQFAVCTAGANCGPGTANFVTNFSQSASVPEPTSLPLLAAGLFGIGGVGELIRRRKRFLTP